MNIRRQQVAHARARDGEDNNATQENREKRSGIKVFDWTGQGCKQDAAADGERYND